jgi:exosortase A-associated hydrolase 2
MNAAPAASGPLFLHARTGHGQRFCLYHAPAGTCRGAVLYVHPFGEEMNKARRMAALQARALARRGYGVLQIDLYGCGDSAGDFADARWDLWLADLALGADWLREQLDQPLTLWGLRLGALLALDFARTLPTPPQAMLLWQPLLSGAQLLTQFLRLKMAAGMLNEGGHADSAGDNSTAALRARLTAGETLEIAGYALAPALAQAIDGLDAARLAVTGCPVHWIEVAARADGQLPPAAMKVAQGWRAAGVDLAVTVVPGPAFWATQEISENTAVLEACGALFDAAAEAVL